MQQHLIMTINQLQDEIIEEFEGMDEWLERYAYIIDLGLAARPSTGRKQITADIESRKASIMQRFS